jgi:hypothetical protein
MTSISILPITDETGNPHYQAIAGDALIEAELMASCDRLNAIVHS